MHLKVVLLAVILVLTFRQQSLAQVTALGEAPAVEVRHSQFGHILGLETGWRDDTIGVKLELPAPPEHAACDPDLYPPAQGCFVNSYEFVPSFQLGTGFRREYCGGTKPAKYYALDPKDPGVKVHEAVILSAFLSGRQVRLVIQGCIYDKPKIIGVNIGRPIY
jgi:hypothetical protein